MHDQKGIRKAAVFLNGLDWETANMLLKRLPAEESRAIRREMVAVDKISSNEINHTVRQFLRETKYDRTPSKLQSHDAGKRTKTVLSDDGIDLFELSSQVPGKMTESQEYGAYHGCSASHAMADETIAEAYTEPKIEVASTAQGGNAAKEIGTASEEPRRFDYLERMSAFDTALFLAEESEQLIAVVLSQMTPRYSGDVLACFEQSLKMGLIRRLAKLDATDEMVLDEIDAVLKDRLKREAEELPNRKPGLALLEQILQVVDNEIGGENNAIGNDIIAGLNEIEYEERLSASSAGYENEMYDEMQAAEDEDDAIMWAFEELALLDDRELGLLFRGQSREIVVQSLLTCDEAFVDRVLKQYPVYEQVTLREMLRSCAANGCCDVDEQRYVRQCVLQGASQLMSDGLIDEIPLHSPQTFADTRSVLVDYSV